MDNNTKDIMFCDNCQIRRIAVTEKRKYEIDLSADDMEIINQNQQLQN